MKTLSTLLLLAVFSVASVMAQDAQTTEPTESMDGPMMKFEETVVDYGTIEHNSDPIRFFNFTNTGTEPLIIKRAKGSCGCTVPDYRKEPIMPGEASEIKVRYDTKRKGKFAKTVKVYTNEGEDPHVLTIKGEVLPKNPELEKSVPEEASPFGQG